MRLLRRVSAAILLLMSTAVPTTARAQGACQGKLALVLSGGGAKGLAHIGVLRVLDSLGVRPDLVVGTSMGAIIGAMYASGYTPNQIEELARGLRLSQLFSNVPRTPRSLGERRPLVVWEPGAVGLRTGNAGEREADVNAALNRALLKGNLVARGDFDSLPIPFRAVAADLRNRAEVVLSSGDLVRAVRASMSIPLVFDPEPINGRYLIDGGLAANVPIGAAREAGATRVIVSDVGWRTPDSVRAGNFFAVADMLVAFLFSQPLDSLGVNDRLVRPAIDSFAALDFRLSRIGELIERGAESAREAMRAHPPCITPGEERARRPREEYRVRRLRVEGGRTGEDILVKRQLGLEEGDQLDPDLLTERMRAMGESDEYRAVWLRPTGPADSLSLDVLVRPAPRRLGFAGVAYDNDLGGQMWLGGVDRGSLIPGLESASTLLLGELRQELMLSFRRSTLTRYIRRPYFTATIARESIRLFNEDGETIEPNQINEGKAALGLERWFGREWLVTVGGVAEAWDAPGSTRENTVGGTVSLQSGPRYRLSGIWAEGTLTTAYRRVHVTARKRFLLATVALTPSVRFGWGRDLPLMNTFMLGGIDGFPGLNIGEVRGDRELSAQFDLSRRVVGPLELKLTAASGRVTTGGDTFPGGHWQAGGRIGLGADTPIGPIRVEYGAARGGRNGFFVRVGEWF
jgi:NTE family protein